MATPKGVIFYLDDLESLEALGYEDRGRLFTALMEYAKTGEPNPPDGPSRYIFPVFKTRIDRDVEKYRARCEKNRENIKKRWGTDTNVYERIPSHTNAYERIPNVPIQKEIKKQIQTQRESSIGAPAPRSAPPRFTPPSLEEVIAFCAARGGKVDPARFYDFYQSKGWMVGKNRMKDWQAAVRNWERDQRPQAAPAAPVRAPKAPAPGAYVSGPADQKARDDMEKARAYLERLKEEEHEREIQLP